MNAYVCSVCGYLYDEETAERSIENNLIAFEDLDDMWTCPVCGVAQDLFKPFDSHRIPDLPTDNNS